MQRYAVFIKDDATSFLHFNYYLNQFDFVFDARMQRYAVLIKDDATPFLHNTYAHIFF